jgi:hypothetical protein
LHQHHERHEPDSDQLARLVYFPYPSWLKKVKNPVVNVGERNCIGGYDD